MFEVMLHQQRETISHYHFNDKYSPEKNMKHENLNSITIATHWKYHYYNYLNFTYRESIERRYTLARLGKLNLVTCQTLYVPLYVRKWHVPQSPGSVVIFVSWGWRQSSHSFLLCLSNDVLYFKCVLF